MQSSDITSSNPGTGDILVQCSAAQTRIMALYTADAEKRADAENTSGNVSPAPAFQTQAVSLLPRLD